MQRLREHCASFRFRGALNDFLRAVDRGRTLLYRFRDRPSIKDSIEAQGIPHTEVDFIEVNGEPVDFGHRLGHGDQAIVYPAGDSRALSAAKPLRAPLPDDAGFVLDVNLGKLAGWMRLLGFDALYRNDFTDQQVATISSSEQRVALTRDRRLLHQRVIVYGYWVRSDDPEKQIREVLHRFRLDRRIRPLHRCLHCNGLIRPVSKEDVWDQLEPKTKRYYDAFFQCQQCRKVYWSGSHSTGISAKLRRVAGPQALTSHGREV